MILKSKEVKYNKDEINDNFLLANNARKMIGIETIECDICKKLKPAVISKIFHLRQNSKIKGYQRLGWNKKYNLITDHIVVCLGCRYKIADKLKDWAPCRCKKLINSIKENFN